MRYSLSLALMGFVVTLLFASIFQLSGNVRMATAQTPTQPAAGPIAKVLQDRFGTDYILNMEVVYESPKMVVLKGNFLTVVRDYNTAFWKAIELLENEYGFNMDKFAVNGLGSEANLLLIDDYHSHRL